MSTCLVGIPFEIHEFPQEAKSSNINPPAMWPSWVKLLPHLDKEPQEPELLGSFIASSCIQLNYEPSSRKELFTSVNPQKNQLSLADWCAKIVCIQMASTKDHLPHQLEKGIFLICGDHAWAGIPSRLLRGLCTLGQLLLFTPTQPKLQIGKNGKMIWLSKGGVSLIWKKIVTQKLHIGLNPRESLFPFFSHGFQW